MSKTKAEAFMMALTKLADQGERGALAVLRRSLAFKPGSYTPAFRYVEPWVQDEDGWHREAYYLVAGLFALHPRLGPNGLAGKMGQLRLRRRSDSIEARFLALLDSDRDQLSDRLRRSVSLLRSDESGIDWPRLIADLLHWFHPDRRVQREWAREFYRAALEAVDTNERGGEDASA